MLKKMVVAFCLVGMVALVYAQSTARFYALGQPWFLGDILLVANQGWQALAYPDQIQGTYDYAANQPGPIILTKSLGSNMAVGLTANTFDRVTQGSVLFSREFFDRGNLVASPPFQQAKFPNLPQYHFGLKIGEHRIGVDAFFEEIDRTKKITQDPWTDTASNVTISGSTIQKAKMINVGGQLSARIAFGSLAWNPWFKYGIPSIAHTNYDTNRSTAAGSTTINLSEQLGQMNGKHSLMAFGSCFDYDFGDAGWAIACFGYRNETFRFQQAIKTSTMVDNVLTASTDTTIVFPTRYDNDYYSYFISYTPKLFNDFLLGFEYQGQCLIKRLLHPEKLVPDTIGTDFYNDIIVCMEKPIAVNKPWCNKFIARGSLRYSLKRAFNPNNDAKIITPDGQVTEISGELTTKWQDKFEGILPSLGFGYKVGRFTMDAAFNLTGWGQGLGFLNFPPVMAMTATVDLHK